MTRDELKVQLLAYEGIASQIYQKSEGHMPMVLVTGPDRALIPFGFEVDMAIGTPQGDMARHAIRLLCVAAAGGGAESVTFVSEAWSVRAPSDVTDTKAWFAKLDEWRAKHGSFEKHPNRVECLILNGACREGTVMQMFRLQRPGENGAKVALIPHGTFDECESRFVDDLPWGPSERWPIFIERLRRDR